MAWASDNKGVGDLWSPEGTRRARRQREVLQVILRGEYGPTWWDIAPAAVATLLAIGLPLGTIAWLWARLGWWAALFAVGAGAYGGRAVVLHRREVAAHTRCRTTRFTLDDVDAADDREFRRIVGRLLRRDGWETRGVLVNDQHAVHLVGRNQVTGRQIGCAFERGHTAGGNGGAVLRPVKAVPDDKGQEETGLRPLLLIVSSGIFGRWRVVWAARNNVHLVDRSQLARWAAGEDLRVVLDLD